MDITIYHNPRCSKSRQTLELLRSRGHQPDVIEYLETPPDAKTIGKLLDMLGLGARDLMRRTEVVYRERGLDDAALSETQLIAAMGRDPILIERPIVVVGARAVIGRPPENVLALLEQ